MRPLLFILTIAAICFSCRKDNISAGETVEIYLLKTYQTMAGKCQINPSASTLQDIATINNQDILEYSQNSYEFTLTDEAIQKVKSFEDRTPFAVTVDKHIIYYGFFKPSISSSSCDHSITMDIAGSPGTKIYLRLGYPGVLEGVAIDDQRNNPKLLATLKKQGKLKE
jgi:hypothetical protein